MDVETYEVEEKTEADGASAVDAQAMDLIDQLGLEGQRKLISKKADGTKARIPYKEMTKQERAVYDVIFPEQTEITKYDEGPIPLRVLQVAAHAKELFAVVEVWHRRVQDKDPLLVGRISRDWNSPRFLLARWGDGLRSFKDLMEEARAILRARWMRACTDKVEECDKFLKNIDNKLDQHLLAGDNVYLP